MKYFLYCFLQCFLQILCFCTSHCLGKSEECFLHLDSRIYIATDVRYWKFLKQAYSLEHTRDNLQYLYISHFYKKYQNPACRADVPISEGGKVLQIPGRIWSTNICSFIRYLKALKPFRFQVRSVTQILVYQAQLPIYCFYQNMHSADILANS
ncbi:hypothetical protein K439DRAFT_1615180 [Ramaria rubella]|nr:hypothetical protein K439DRAFT_1615180 [Ramaria rubella]